MPCNEETVERAKQVIKTIRQYLKKRVKLGDLPDITYQVSGVKKPHHYDVCVHFDHKPLSSAQARGLVCSLYDDLTELSGSEYGWQSISIKVKSHLKGEALTSIPHINTNGVLKRP